MALSKTKTHQTEANENAVMPVRTCAPPLPLTIDVASPKTTRKEASTPKVARACEDVDQDSPIFSTVGSPEDSTTGDDELGDYELSYLHNLYQDELEDAILPESEAPPSLGISALKPLALAGTGLKSTSADARAMPTLETPTAGDHDTWDDSDMSSSPRASSPVPGGARKALAGVKSAGAISRKRKGDAAGRPPASLKLPRTAAKMRGASPDIDTASSRDSSEAPSNRPTLDGMEIRPEDDPLGLFSRDPATLTAEEQRLLKKQRRLLKNRESAQLSRHRKKCHLHTLEKQVEALKKEKATIQQRVNALLEENERLRRGV